MTTVYEGDFPVLIVNKNLVLREIELTDANEYYYYMNHPGVSKYLAEEDIPQSISAAERDLQHWRNLFYKTYTIYWSLALRDSNLVIGTCGFNHINDRHHRAEISYDLSPDHWNKGYATATVKALCDFAFEKMDIRRIQATVEKSNFPSMRVLMKNNFQREGLLRQYSKLAGVNQDFYMYSLVKKQK